MGFTNHHNLRLKVFWFWLANGKCWDVEHLRHQTVAACKPVKWLIFTSTFYGRRCSTLIATGPVPCRATVAICEVVNCAKSDDLKQVVKLPALNSTESRVAVSSLLETMAETMIRTPPASFSRSQQDCRNLQGVIYNTCVGKARGGGVSPGVNIPSWNIGWLK